MGNPFGNPFGGFARGLRRGTKYYLSLPLQINLLATYGTDATLVRNSSQFGIDNLNVMHQIPAGVPVFDGMRPVTNRLTRSDDFSDPVWTESNISKIHGQIDPNGGTAATRVTSTSINGRLRLGVSSSSPNKLYRNAIWLKRAAGSGPVQLVQPDSSTTFTITEVLTTSWQRFSVSSVANANGVAYIGFNISLAGESVDVSFADQNDITGLSNQNPSDHIATTTAPATKWFDYENPFTVDGNGVVTEGAHVPLTTGRNGILLEPLSTNKCLCDYYIPADRTAYGPTYVEAQTLRKGSVCEIVTRTTLDFDTIGTLLSGTANTVGAQYLITGVALLGAGDSAKQDLAAIGTKSYYVDGAFVQNMRDSADNVVMTLSGDIAGVLSIVADQVAVDAAGYGRVTNGGKVYQLDDILGTGSVYAYSSGQVGNLNSHSVKAIMREISGNTARLGLNSGDTAQVDSAIYTEVKLEDAIPSATSRVFQVYASAGDSVNFLAPQLEELPFATGPIPSTAGATGTRLATILSAPTPIYTSGIWHQPLEWTPRGVALGRIEWLLHQMVDASNGLKAYSTGVQIVFEKVVGGVSEYATFDLPAVLDTSYKIDLLMYADYTLGLFVNDVSGGAGATELITLSDDRDFTSDTGFWDKGSGWSIGGGVATHTGAQGNLTRSGLFSVAKLFNVTLIETGGVVNLYIGSSSFKVGLSGNISYTEFCGGAANLYIQSASENTVDNVSAKAIHNNSTTAKPTLNPSTTYIGSDGVNSIYGNIQHVGIDNRRV